MLKHIFFFYLFFTAACSLAQTGQQYLFSYLGTRNGLTSQEVMCVQQDTKGFIWIATLNGLQRYDGNRFLTFRHEADNARTLPNDEVRYMRIDRQNRLWLLCSENRVGYFNTSDFTFHEIKVESFKEMMRESPNALTIDDSGNVILIIYRYGIYTYNENTGEFSSKNNAFAVPLKWRVQSILEDSAHNSYWLGCDSGLVKYNTKKKTLSYRGHNVEKDKVIDAYSYLRYVAIPYLDRKGRFWLLSWPPAGPGPFLYSYNKVSDELKDWEHHILTIIKNKYHEFIAFNEQKDGTLWLFGSNVLVKFNETTQAFEYLENNLSGEFSIRYDAVRGIFEDRELNLWVSTDKGLFYFNPSSQLFHAVTDRRFGSDSVYTPDVTGIMQTRKGDIYVSTWGNAMFVYDSTFKALDRDIIRQSLSLGEGLVWCMYERPNGDIWRGNQDGNLFIYNAQKNKTSRLHPAVFDGRTIRQIVGDAHNDLWMATNGGRVIKWDSRLDSFLLVQQFNSPVQKLFADKKGRVWVCTKVSGLYSLNIENGNVIDHYTSIGPEGKRLPSAGATDIIQYNDSTYAIAGAGLSFLNISQNTIRTLPPALMPSNNITNIIKDRKGLIWASTSSGLCSVQITEGHTIVSTYDERDGVHTNSFNVAASCILRDGRLAIGTSHDLIVFNPEKTLRGEKDPKVSITGFALMSKWLPVDSLTGLKTVELSHDKNSVIIEFSTLTYMNDYQITYMLEGLDKDWVTASETRQAVYSYLPAGGYTFRIRCVNADGGYSDNITTLKIKVKSPFWSTYWFMSLLAIIFTGLLYSFDKFRINRIRETAKVRAKIAKSITKDMSSTLSNINMLSEMARMKAETDINRTKEYVGQISDSSNRMMEVMDDIMWSINPENDEMEYTLMRMKKYALEIQSKYNVEVSFNAGEDVKKDSLDMHHRYELFLIYKEALLNAGKHANSRFIDVDFHCNHGRLVLKIIDDGVGFDVESITYGRGLNEIRKRAAVITAKLDITSEIDTGTVVLLVVDV